jgi:Transposase DDE domain group 1
MRENDSRPGQIPVRFTSKSLSGHGGLVALMRLLGRLGLRQLIEQVLPDGRTSPNQRSVFEIAQSLIATVLTGGNRFTHVQRIGNDGVVAAILGIRKTVSAMTLTRYFGGIRAGQVEHLAEQCDRFCLRFADANLEEVLDLDSTVLQRHGFQQGSRRGYSPKRRGRTTQHPIMAMLTRQKLIAHFWLRAGDASPLRGAVEFLDELMTRIAGLRIKAVRTDSGFSSSAFLARLEHHLLKYACAVTMHRPLQRFIRGMQNWTSTGEGSEIAEAEYHAPYWTRPRRLIVVRKKVTNRRPEGKVLFEIPGYTFLAVVTNMTDPAEQVWKFYNGRGECENLLKELKHDFGFDGFCLQRFAGTEAVLRLIVLVFNLVQIFRLTLQRKHYEQLRTLRTRIFIAGAALGREQNTSVLRLGLSGVASKAFDKLLETVTTVMQLGQVSIDQPLVLCPNPLPIWRARNDERLRPRILGGN